MSSRAAPAVVALLAGGVDAFYIALVQHQGTGIGPRVVLVATCLGAAALFAAFAAVLRDGHLRSALLAVATFALVCLALLGAASIGLVLVLPALLTLWSLRESRHS